MLDSLGGGECAGGCSSIRVVGRMCFVCDNVWVCQIRTLRARGVEAWEWVEGGSKTMGGGGGDVEALICCSDGTRSLCVCE